MIAKTFLDKSQKSKIKLTTEKLGRKVIIEFKYIDDIVKTKRGKQPLVLRK